MKTSYLWSLLLPGVSFSSLVAKGSSPETKTPNIVVVLADDLGTHELSCYGGRNIDTPHIDRLANEGMLFNNNYASATMSVPIRASLFTGLYPVRHGSYQNHRSSYPDIKSVTHYLSQIGYRVGRSGKRHTTPRSVYDFEEVPGFEENCVSKTAYYSTDGIKEFIQCDNEPFTLFVCSIHPHAPWTWGNPDELDPDQIMLPPNSVDNAETRSVYRDYLAEIKALDEEVGAVVQVLEECGKLDNTLVVFLGEQGPQFPFGKWTCYRYGQHSALIARYPSGIKAQSTSNALLQYEDILPTLIDFGGGEVPPEIDGRSFLQVLYNQKEDHRKWVYGIHNNIPEGTAYPIRSIQDDRYKLIVNLTPEVDYFEKHLMNVNNRNQRQVWGSWLESAAANDPVAKTMTERYVRRPAIELYDLKGDPWEMNNLAGDGKYRERISIMVKELEKWMAAQGDKGIAMDVQ